MNSTREHFGFPPLDPALIYSYVGNGAAVLMRRAFGPEASETLIAEALQFFLKFYRAHALEHTELYPGIREAIEELARSDHKLAVLTNKPVRISFDIIAALRLGDHFVRVYGGDSFPRKKPDPAAIYQLLEETKAPPREAWMVGDSGVDVQTARNAGIRCCGVAWGFQPEAFATDPPDAIIAAPAELPLLLFRENSHDLSTPVE